ncbi:MAG: SDR family oxidoreductase [Prevotellaceae bacterium]|jgi:NAD(P)-dependent dehydrogenase (short-subunit alcohol dehydrogenase family)|nr:SDR family oxidoreductase [Prevotellaceae bacterium]
MKDNLFCIKDKVVIITGGCGVLGSNMARYLAEQGAKIAVLDMAEEKGKILVDEIKSAGGDALFLTSNVLDRNVLENNKEKIIETYGCIDVLVNAAGGNMSGATIAPDKTIFDLEIEAFKKVVDLNLFGTVLPTVVFAKAMADRGLGNIINIASESALRPLTRVAGYGAAKAAVANFTKYMAGELALKFGERFRVNALAPGFFITEQNRSLLLNPDGSYTDRAKTILAHTPYGRFGEADELLGSLHYLVSDASRFVSGIILVVDGGFDAFSI